MAQPDAEALWRVVERNRLRLVAQPVLAGAPWEAAHKSPEEYTRDEVEFFAYSDTPEPLNAIRPYATDGKIIQGEDSRGRPLFCKKLDDKKLPPSLNIAQALRSPMEEDNDLLYATGLRQQLFHASLQDGQEALIVHISSRDDNQLLDKLESAGLLHVGWPLRRSPVAYTKNDGSFVALTLPPSLMQTILRTESNHVQELGTVMPGLSEAQRRKLAEGGFKLEPLKTLVENFIQPPEKERVESAPAREKQRQESKPPLTLQEIAGKLPVLHFALKRSLRGEVQYLLTGVGGQAHRLLTEAEDGVRLRLSSTAGQYFLPTEEDVERLKVLVGPDRYHEETNQILPATIPGNFFNKYSVAFGGASQTGDGCMYVAAAVLPSGKSKQNVAALAQELKSYGLDQVSVVTGKRQSPPVVRVTLSAAVAKDLLAQAKSLTDKGRVTLGELSGDAESLDAVAKAYFKVKEMEVTATHAASAVIVPMPIRNTVAAKPPEPMPEQRRDDAMREIERTNNDHMVLVHAHKGQEQRYHLLWRSSESNPKNDRLGDALRWLAPTQQVSDYGRQMTYEPRYLHGISLDEATFEKLENSIEALPLVDDRPVAVKRVEARVREYFNGCDRVAYMTKQRKPFEAALEHLKGRDVRLVNVIHPSPEEIDQQIAKLNSFTIHDAVSQGRHMEAPSVAAVREIEAVVTHLGYAPEVQEKLRECEHSLHVASSESGNAAREYQEALGYLQTYRQWIAEHQPAKPGYVTQLAVLDATKKTQDLLLDPEVVMYMTRLPDVWQGGDQKKTVMLLYPDDKLLTQLRSELGGKFTRSLTKGDKGMEIGSLQQKIRHRYQSEEENAKLPTMPRTAEGVLRANQERLNTLKECRPWLMMEKSESPIKGERKIEDQPVLIFKTPLPGSKNIGKIEALMEVFESFIKPRQYFGDTIRKMPELNEDERRYLELFNERAVLQKERANFEAMSRWLKDAEQYNYYCSQLPEDIRDDWALRPSDRSETVEVRLRQRIAELAGRIGPLLDEMEKLENQYPGVESKPGTEHSPPTKRKPGIDEIIKNYCKLRDDEGGEEVASVRESKGRVFTLSGESDRDGYESLDDLLRNEQERPEYIKIYITPGMARACDDHLTAKANYSFMNSSQEGVESRPEAQMRDTIRDLHNKRLRQR